MKLRPEVQAFAELMEHKLRLNDHKGGWDHDEPEALIRRLREETLELEDLLRATEAIDRVPASASLALHEKLKLAWESADVANFAMMIADVCGGLRARLKGRKAR